MSLQLSDIRKVIMFYAVVIGLSFLVVMIVPLFTQGEAVLLINMLTPLIATLLMLFVFTREGFTVEGRASSPLASEYLGGESGLFTWIGALLVAGWLLSRRQSRPSYAPA